VIWRCAEKPSGARLGLVLTWGFSLLGGAGVLKRGSAIGAME
jgi:hypothetical protein